MRYILNLSEYYQFEPIYILALLQAESPSELVRSDIEQRVSWAYRIRALGVKQKYILAEYNKLPTGFFKEQK